MRIAGTTGDYNSNPERLKAVIVDLLKEKVVYLTPDRIAQLGASSLPGDVYPERDLPQQIEILFTALISQIGQKETIEFFKKQISPLKDLMHPKYFNFIETGAFTGEWEHRLFA